MSPRRRQPCSKLDKFLARYDVAPADLSRLSGCSRQHLLRLRKGTAEPTRPVMRALRIASGKLLRRRVRAEELFDL